MNNLETLRLRKKQAIQQRHRMDTRIQTLNQLIAQEIYEQDEKEKAEKGTYPSRQKSVEIRNAGEN